MIRLIIYKSKSFKFNRKLMRLKCIDNKGYNSNSIRINKDGIIDLIKV